MTPTNGKAEQSLSDFQTGIVVAAAALLDMEQLISDIRILLVDTISSLQDSEGGVISVSEVCELHSKILDFLDSVVGNIACILAHFQFCFQVAS